MVLITSLERSLGLERFPLYGRYGYVETTQFLMIRIALSCRLSTNVPLLSVRGLHCKERITATSFTGLYTVGGYGDGYFFPYMGGSII
jgi:hypothetical protein